MKRRAPSPPLKRKWPGTATLKRLHADPDFAAARDERARARMIERQPEMQRLSKAARRGVDVPPELEAEWKALTNRRRKGALSNAEAAAALGLQFNGKGKI